MIDEHQVQCFERHRGFLLVMNLSLVKNKYSGKTGNSELKYDNVGKRSERFGEDLTEIHFV